jgi:carboxyl-terminal processing protease
MRQSLIILFAIPIITCGAISKDNLERVTRFVDIYNTAFENHLEINNPDEMLKSAIDGLINSLDPYSYYFSAEEMRRIIEKRSGSVNSIGINYLLIKDTLHVVSTIKTGPARESGIIPGDKITEIDGIDITGIKKDSIETLLKGKVSSYTELKLVRKNKEILKKRIRREKIPIYSIDAAFLFEGTDVGYLAINRFMATTYIEMIDSLSVLRDLGMEKLILDLRGNPGGILEQAYLVADEFIPEGYTIVFTRGRKPEFNENYLSTPGGEYENIPLIVLVDDNTASAPEIVAGAIQDLDRGIVIGMRSFGKGLVQRSYPFEDGSEFWLTVARYYTPSGRCIQKSQGSRYLLTPPKPSTGNPEKGFEFRENIEIEPEFITADSTPVFKTRGGRLVMGGGGIKPDIETEDYKITALTKKLISRNYIEKICLEYLSGEGSSLFNSYRQNYTEFLNNYRIPGDLAIKLKNLAVSDKITWSDVQFKKDEDYIMNLMKSALAASIWSNNQAKEIMLQKSTHISEAFETFPMIEKLLQVN